MRIVNGTELDDGVDEPNAIRNDEASTCRVCGCTMDLVHDDDGDLICCDCMFEEETHDINQP